MMNTIVFPSSVDAVAAMPKNGTEAQSRFLHRAAESIMASASAGKKAVDVPLDTSVSPMEMTEIITFLKSKGYMVTSGYSGEEADYQLRKVNKLIVSWTTESPLLKSSSGQGNGFYDR